MEKVLANRVAVAAEAHIMLPPEQMGNRANRSPEAAIYQIAERARSAIDAGEVLALLALDFTGAFDRVHYNKLLEVLEKKGFPEWILRWVSSFLADRVCKLRFNGRDSEDVRIPAGVPQGSPLSPILFILYKSSLFDRLR